MKKMGSFKDYVNSINNSSYPYKFLVQNTEEFKQKEKDAGIDQSVEEKDIETKKSLLQYLLHVNAVNQ